MTRVRISTAEDDRDLGTLANRKAGNVRNNVVCQRVAVGKVAYSDQDGNASWDVSRW